MVTSTSDIIPSGYVEIRTNPIWIVKSVMTWRLKLWVTRFGPKMFQIGPKWDKPWTFSDRCSAKMYWNMIWKSPGFVPFGTNMTHFRATLDIPGLRYSAEWSILGSNGSIPRGKPVYRTRRQVVDTTEWWRRTAGSQIDEIGTKLGFLRAVGNHLLVRRIDRCL